MSCLGLFELGLNIVTMFQLDSKHFSYNMIIVDVNPGANMGNTDGELSVEPCESFSRAVFLQLKQLHSGSLVRMSRTDLTRIHCPRSALYM